MAPPLACAASQPAAPPINQADRPPRPPARARSLQRPWRDRIRCAAEDCHIRRFRRDWDSACQYLSEAGSRPQDFQFNHRTDGLTSAFMEPLAGPLNTPGLAILWL